MNSPIHAFPTKTIELSYIRTIEEFKSLLENVKKKSDHYLLEQEGRRVAVLISPDLFEAVVEHDIEDAKRDVRTQDTTAKSLFAIMDTVQTKNLEFSEEEVERDTVAVREEIRRLHVQNRT